MKGTNWKPIETLPERLKDGRDVLVWNGSTSVGAWDQDAECWMEMGEYRIIEITHFAEVTPP